MTPDNLAEQVRDACRDGTSLRIDAAGTRAAWGREVDATPLDVTGYAGIVEYVPEELVITVRCGTPLSEINAALAANRQVLAFDPPRFGGDPTIGGIVASGLAGPARPWVGSVRDFVLGVRLLTGRGDIVSLGGRVMKNVAGYDVSRLMAGAWGTLGVILEVSLRLLPAPAETICLGCEFSAEEFVTRTRELAKRLPVRGAVLKGSEAQFRIDGSSAVQAAARDLVGGAESEPTLLDGARELTFTDSAVLWRCSVPVSSRTFLEDASLLDWGGALRWLEREIDPRPELLAGEHAVQVGGAVRELPFQPLSGPVGQLHERLKAAFDPAGILNPGLMYGEL